MWPEDQIKDFRRREFEFDCVDMVLTQAAVETPVVFRGKGYVRQAPDETLLFKIYVTQTTGTTAAQDFKAQFSGQPGRYFPESTYFDLKATDRDGREWTAKRLLPDRAWPSLPNQPPVASGRLWSGITSTAEASNQKHYMELYFFSDVRVPYTHGTRSVIDGRESWRRDQAKFSTVGCDFVIRESEGGFVVEVQSEEPFVERFANRIQEALQYILARSLFWRIQISATPEQDRYEFADRREFAADPHMRPPLLPTTTDYHTNVWRLFSLYLEYIVRHTPDSYWNPCAYYLNYAREASAATREAWATAIGVTVEALANFLPQHSGGPTNEERRKVIDALIAHLKTLPEAERFGDRVANLLRTLHTPRIRDRLQPLIQSGRAHRQHVKAWQELRNKRVHPNYEKFKDITPDELQREADLTNQATVLLYHITFALIGYEGPHTDYGSAHWPSKPYPLQGEPGPSTA